MARTSLAHARSTFLFGEYLPAVTPSSTNSGNRQFTGKEAPQHRTLLITEPEYHDWNIGRFLEPDTVDTGSSPQSLNRYSYVRKNPTGFTDPTGNTEETGNKEEWINVPDQTA